MRFSIYAVAFTCIAQLSPASLRADGTAVSTEKQACEILKRAALELCLSRRNLAGRYYCDPLPDQPFHFVVGLRYAVTPDELVGSNLIGWYGVRKADGQVFEWDIDEDLPHPLASHCPFEDG
jgi:hypothetical protein